MLGSIEESLDPTNGEGNKDRLGASLQVFITVKAASDALDSLIDSSPTPILNSFLDIQDELEERTNLMRNDGLEAFYNRINSRRDLVGEIDQAISETRVKGEELRKDLQAIKDDIPSRELASSFQERLSGVVAEVRNLRGVVEDFDLPDHPAFDQSHHNLIWKKTMDEKLNGLDDTIASRKLEEVVGRYSEGCRIVEESMTMGETINGINVESTRLLELAGVINNLDWTSSTTLLDSSLPSRLQPIVASISGHLHLIPLIKRNASSILVELNHPAIPATFRVQFKFSLSNIDCSTLQTALSILQSRQAQLDVALSFQLLRDEYCSIVRKYHYDIRAKMMEIRWRDDGNISSVEPDNFGEELVDVLRRCSQLRQHPFIGLQPGLMPDLDNQGMSAQISLDVLRMIENQKCSMNESLLIFERFVSEIGDAHSALHESGESCTREVVEDIHQRLEAYLGDLHYDILFLGSDHRNGSRIPSELAELLSSQDLEAREKINSMSILARSKLEELRVAVELELADIDARTALEDHKVVMANFRRRLDEMDVERLLDDSTPNLPTLYESDRLHSLLEELMDYQISAPKIDFGNFGSREIEASSQICGLAELQLDYDRANVLISNLLDSIDGTTAESNEADEQLLKSALEIAKVGVGVVETKGVLYHDDRRVVEIIKRLLETLDDLEKMVIELKVGKTKSCQNISSLGHPSSTPRRASSRNSSIPIATPSRSRGSPLVRPSSSSTRAVSESTPCLPTTRRRISLSPVPLLYSSQHLTPHHSFKPTSKRTIDREVARIVRELPRLQSSIAISAVEGVEEDDSGKYYIGERVHYIRILRSKTCMVRIGGGWLELRRYVDVLSLLP